MRHSGLNHRFGPRPLFSVFFMTMAYSTTLRSSTGTSRLRQQAAQQWQHSSLASYCSEVSRAEVLPEPQTYTLDVITYSKFYPVNVNIQRWYSCLSQTLLVVLYILSSHLVNRLYFFNLRSAIVIALHPPTLPRSNLARYAWLLAATFYHIFVDTRIPALGQATSVPTPTQALQLVASVGPQLPGHYTVLCCPVPAFEARNLNGCVTGCHSFQMLFSACCCLLVLYLQSKPKITFICWNAAVWLCPVLLFVPCLTFYGMCLSCGGSCLLPSCDFRICCNLQLNAFFSEFLFASSIASSDIFEN